MQTRFIISLILGSFLLVSCSSWDKSESSHNTHSENAMSSLRPSVSPEQLAKWTPAWPVSSQQIAKAMIEKYGGPNEWTPNTLIWNAITPFKRIVVHREEVAHNFPMPHKDIVEHVVNYRIPSKRVGELSKFDGSISFNRTLGELSVRSSDEAMNILALNLASDILEGRKSARNARLEYSQRMIDFAKGNRSAQMENLQFLTRGNAADPDKALENPMLRQAQEEEMAE